MGALHAIREELRYLLGWGPRHRRLLARLAVVILATLAIDLVAAALVYVLEHDAHGSEVRGYWDAFFFSTVQLLTVSSQMRNPVTTGGRIVDIFLEVWAVVVVAGSAGAISSFFQHDPRAAQPPSGTSQTTPSGGSVTSAE